MAPFLEQRGGATVLQMTVYNRSALGLGSVLFPLWAAYSTVTTARQLPKDASDLAKLLADPPIYLPWLLTSLVIVYWAYLIWQIRKGDVTGESVTPANNSSNVTHGQAAHVFHGQFGTVQFGDNNYNAPTIKAVPVPADTLLQAVDQLEGNLRQKLATVRQAANEGRLVLWGRKEIKPTHHQSPMTAAGVWSPIPAEYWQDHRIECDYATLTSKSQPQTAIESGGLQLADRYWELRLSKDATNEACRSNPARDQRSQISNRPDLNLKDVIGRIAARRGIVPEAGRDDRKLISEIRLEILDEIRFSGLTVWGRFQNRALKKLDSRRLEDANLDLRRGEISIPNYSGMDVYTDIMFHSQEVARVWPE